jgi:hypothetical protein
MFNYTVLCGKFKYLRICRFFVSLSKTPKDFKCSLGIFYITLQEGLSSNTVWQFCFTKRISCRKIDRITVYLREKEFCVVHKYLGVRVFLPLLKLSKVNLKINQMSGSFIPTTSNNMKGFVFRPQPHD